jgi:hypothetical protein
MRRRLSSSSSSSTINIRTATATTTMEMDTAIRAMAGNTMTWAMEEEDHQIKTTLRRTTTIQGRMDLAGEGDRCPEEEGVR